MVGKRRRTSSRGSKPTSTSPSTSSEFRQGTQEDESIIEILRRHGELLTSLLEQQRQALEILKRLENKGMPIQDPPPSNVAEAVVTSGSTSETRSKNLEPLSSTPRNSPLNDKVPLTTVEGSADWKQALVALAANLPPPVTLPSVEIPIFSGQDCGNPINLPAKRGTCDGRGQSPETKKLTRKIAEDWAMQEEIRADVLSKPYDPNGEMDMSEFFIHQLCVLRTLTLPIPEEMTLSALMRLFPLNIRSLWAIVTDDRYNVHGAIKFLERQAIAFPPKRVKFEDPTARDLSPDRKPMQWVHPPVNTGGMAKLPVTDASSSQAYAFNPFSIPPPTFSSGNDW